MPRKKAEQPPPSDSDPRLDAVVLLLVSGKPLAELRDALELPAAEANALIDAARRRVTIAAKYHPDEQLGTALTRLNDLYARALKVQDNRTALAAQKEIGKLLALETAAAAAGSRDPADGDQTDDDAELAAIAAHLLPLKLAPANHPLREHVRVAAERIRDLDQ